jgi:hypothetical protein
LYLCNFYELSFTKLILAFKVEEEEEEEEESRNHAHIVNSVSPLYLRFAGFVGCVTTDK